MSAANRSRPGRRPDPQLRSRWEQALMRFEHSGLSAPAFCAQQKLSLPSFYAWRRRLKAQPPDRPSRPDTPLLPIRLVSAPPVEVLLPTGTILRLQPGCDLPFVRSLLDALEADPC